MSLKSLLMPAVTARIFSHEALQARRAKAERQRRARGERHQLHYFHQVDDPYSALMAQCLPQLLGRYDVELLPHLVGPPPDAAAPARELLVAYSRRDAALLARRHGLVFADPGAQPAAGVVAQASALLLAGIEAGRFVDVVGDVSAALWCGKEVSNHGLQGAMADAVAQHVHAGNALRERLGHYLGATLHYGGEWYWGIDRLHHLERRLQALGVQRGQLKELMFAPGDGQNGSGIASDDGGAIAAGSSTKDAASVDFFVSLRSPYSAIVTPRIYELARQAGASVRLRYVLPMVMRGLPVPPAKRQYISHDAAREARLHGVPFGRLNDPIGKPTERGLAVLARAEAQGRGREFLHSFMHGVWAEGVNAGSDRGLRRLAERAGLSWVDAQAALADEGWRATAQANRDEMFSLGLWGVPSFRVGEMAVWGQDRLWAVHEALMRQPAAPSNNGGHHG